MVSIDHVNADDFTRIRNTPPDSFFEVLLDTSKIDGKNGITIEELESLIGPYDSDKLKSQWINGKKYMYKLSNGNKLIVESFSGNILHVFYIKPDGTMKVLWK